MLDESLGQAAASWRAAGRLFDRIALSDGPDVVGHCRQLRVPSPRELLEHGHLVVSRLAFVGFSEYSIRSVGSTRLCLFLELEKWGVFSWRYGQLV